MVFYALYRCKCNRVVKHVNRHKCKETVYLIKAQPEFKGVLIATENVLKTEEDRLSKLNQLEEGNKEDFEGIARQRSLERD